MTKNELLTRWGLSGLKINIGILEAEFNPTDSDMSAAWQLYVELITRVTTQQLLPEHGDEQSALDSVYQIFPLTREILKSQGHDSKEFTLIAVVVLNQVVRPFTAKWHRIFLNNQLDADNTEEFRNELSNLQNQLRNYTKLLADMANVEDLTVIEENVTNE